MKKLISMIELNKLLSVTQRSYPKYQVKDWQLSLKDDQVALDIRLETKCGDVERVTYRGYFCTVFEKITLDPAARAAFYAALED